jgi:hypothetical protein
MKDFRETIGHILVMQLLVTAVLVDEWTNRD